MLIGTLIGSPQIDSGQSLSAVVDIGALIGGIFGPTARRIVAFGIITPATMTGTVIDVLTEDDAASASDIPIVTGNPPAALTLSPKEAIIFTEFPFPKIRFQSDMVEGADRVFELYAI